MRRPNRPDQRGWTSAFPEEHCNFHPNRPATGVYGGTPLCEACEQLVRGGSDADAPDDDDAAAS
jgi:hypothetical protein